MKRIAIPITTAANGTATVRSPNVSGLLYAARLVLGTLSVGVNCAITDDSTNAALVTFTNLQADGQNIPAEGTLLTVNGKIKAVVTSGGSALTGTLYLYIDGEVTDFADVLTEPSLAHYLEFNDDHHSLARITT